MKGSKTMFEKNIIMGAPELFLHEKEIVLYGAGTDAESYLNWMIKLGANVTAFCDSNKKGKCCGLPIVDIDFLKQNKDKLFIVISSTAYFSEILTILTDNGLDEIVLELTETSISYLLLSLETTSVNAISFNKNVLNRMFRLAILNPIKATNMVTDNSILIYQPGKVGSSTVYESL